MSDPVYYLNLNWDVEPTNEGWYLTVHGEPPEHLEGRTLYAKPGSVPEQRVTPADGGPPYTIDAHPTAEVWECKRDGSGVPLALIGNSPRLLKVLPPLLSNFGR